MGAINSGRGRRWSSARSYKHMGLENSSLSSQAEWHSGIRVPFGRASLVLALGFFVWSGPTSAQAPLKRDVLILSDVGMSHTLTAEITQAIAAGMQETSDRHVEVFSESLDLQAFPGRPSREDVRDWLAKKYGDHGLDVVVAVGPGAIDFLSHDTQALFSDVPIVICGAISDQLGNLKLDSRFTGTWVKLEPEKTLELALQLFPDTRHVFVVGGSSDFDKAVISLTRVALRSFKTKAEILYLTDMEMNSLLERLRILPDHSIELYTSFFQDSAGNKFLNSTRALPMIATASKAPDFGMSDTYIGHGIVGGYVLTFGKQAKITARIIAELLEGKTSRELPIEALPSAYIFDWHELQTWNIPERSLPAGSVIFFREPSFWDRTKWIWITSLLIIAGLSAIAVFLQHSRQQLKVARDRQMQLSGMLINAEEHERSRVAAELHDDFSQRLAILALGLENVEEATPASIPVVHKQLHELAKSTSELGADLHILSHRLHSSTLESLGLVPAVAALCREFTTKQGIGVEFTANEIPRSVHPDAALCIFRIAQEGLRNLKKYSGAKVAEVELQMTGDRLEISIRDEGRGFDLAELRHSEGLGIRSMEERARLLGGKFEIHSKPGKGTKLEAWVPVKAAARHATI
jgi:signal transduction histidine kinase